MLIVKCDQKPKSANAMDTYYTIAGFVWSGRSRGVELTNNDDPSEPRVLSKDYERDKDDQGIF